MWEFHEQGGGARFLTNFSTSFILADYHLQPRTKKPNKGRGRVAKSKPYSSNLGAFDSAPLPPLFANPYFLTGNSDSCSPSPSVSDYSLPCTPSSTNSSLPCSPVDGYFPPGIYPDIPVAPMNSALARHQAQTQHVDLYSAWLSDGQPHPPTMLDHDGYAYPHSSNFSSQWTSGWVSVSQVCGSDWVYERDEKYESGTGL